MRIRNFGLLANRARNKKLALCRQLLHQPVATSAMMLRLTGVDITVCPVCREGRLRLTAILLPDLLSQPPIMDTS